MLDPRLLRAFTAIVDAGSFTLAAERLHMTQSTISQQLARLEGAVGTELIERAARPVEPTAAGERLLGYARRLLALQQEAQAAVGEPAGTAAIRIGVPEDIVDAAMARTFSSFARRHREIRLDVTTGLSRDLTRRYRSGEFDIVIVKESEPGPDCRVAFAEPIAWFESIDTPPDIHTLGTHADPVPLVAFPPGGLYREAMFERIEREDRRWYVAFAASSLHNVLVAVEAGLGLSLLPVRAAQDYRVRPYAPFDMETAMAVSLYSWESTGAVSELVDSMQSVLAARATPFRPRTDTAGELR
ncbi:DNA-binding transcriptional LysR family regulator [Pseudaminobacter salicylatoxidans]|uniref:DNA-binding transcriptional LysR family regulator n=2 Tax=Pseudaminobacter salicylatoxidans TaxID=93369 RepID=A0A316C445_PSESE|nr:DNA-binding transcriptional LysR family regulator [Pseudaminobacter salicylatoxidans]